MDEQIKNYTVCSCGAITLYFFNGESNSIKRSNLKKFNISLKGIPKLQKEITYCCNHCVNHYALDLCECGSGLMPEKCCKKESREQFGKSVEYRVKFY